MSTKLSESSTLYTASAESTTCHTITAAISIGLPSSSLTLSRPLSKLRTRIDTLRLAKKGLFQRRPLSLRSEEHTSELQSLMRISYAVFCLKKKHIKKAPTYTHTTNT